MPRVKHPAGKADFSTVANAQQQTLTAGLIPGRGYTVLDVANLYAVGVATVLQWIRAGELKAVNVSRSKLSKKPRWRITQAALDAFEAARAAGSQKPEPQQRRRPSGGASYYPEK